MPPEITALFQGVDWLLWSLLAAIAAAVMHVVVAVLLGTIAQRTNTSHSWMSWFPILNVFLMCNIGRKSLLWGFLMFIPCLTPIAMLVLAAGMARQRGVTGWSALLAVLPVLNLLWLMYLAYGPGSRFGLMISWNIYRLTRGVRLLARDIPSLAPRSSSMVVAEVCPIPRDAANLGLKNLSGTAWKVKSTTGSTHTVSPDEILFLKSGVQVQFGNIDGFIEETPIASSWPRRIGGVLLGGLAAPLLLTPICLSALDFLNGSDANTPVDNRPSGREVEQWENELQDLTFDEF